MNHKQGIRLFGQGMYNAWTGFLTAVGLVVFIGLGFLGPQPSEVQSSFVTALRRIGEYRLWIALALFVAGAYAAMFKAIETDRKRQAHVVHLGAKADQAHRVFYRLLQESHRLCLELPETRAEKVHQWDLRVQEALIAYCKPGRRTMYYSHTRAADPKYPEMPLREDCLGVAQAALDRLLEAINDDPERTLA